MFARNFEKLKIVIDDLKARKRGHEKEVLINLGILLIILALIITGIVLLVKKLNKPVEITLHREINIPMFPTTLPLEDKEDLVFETLTSSGYSVAGACGIMGNIAVESPEYDPTVLGPGDIPYGLFQWTDVGDRKKKLKSWCKEHGLGHDTIEGQLAFAIYELSGGDSIACRLDDFLRTTDDAYAACSEFAAGFERCISDEDNGCGIYAGSLYPEFYKKPYQGLNKRLNKALNYYERYKCAPPKMEVYDTDELNNTKYTNENKNSSDATDSEKTINISF